MSWQTKLIHWFEQNKRDLPWRHNRTPYRVYISEMMLQQTTVKTVIPYYLKFLERFPSLEVLAKAPVEEVLKYWSGLGYYSRARNLHKTAQMTASLPKTVEGLMKLPGIGRYSAGAIASIAFDQRVPILDGNVKRVLSRLFALKDNISSPKTTDKLWRLAEEVLPAQHVGAFNEALMELGATVCTPKEPTCLLCPLKQDCQALAQGLERKLPIQKKREKALAVTRAVIFVEKNGKLLLARRPKQNHLGEMWEFPTLDIVEANPRLPAKALATAGGRPQFTEFGKITHSIMNKRILLRLFRAKPVSSPSPQVPSPKGGENWMVALQRRYTETRWIKPSSLDEYPTSSANKKALAVWMKLKTPVVVGVGIDIVDPKRFEKIVSSPKELKRFRNRIAPRPPLRLRGGDSLATIWAIKEAVYKSLPSPKPEFISLASKIEVDTKNKVWVRDLKLDFKIEIQKKRGMLVVTAIATQMR